MPFNTEVAAAAVGAGSEAVRPGAEDAVRREGNPSGKIAAAALRAESGCQ